MPMLLAQTFDNAIIWIAGNLPIIVGGIVSVITLSIPYMMYRQRRLNEAERLAAAAAAAAAAANTSALKEEKALNWEPTEQSYADRREAVRRDGAAVRVVLASTTFRNGVSDGFVLDRSTGGLRVAMSIAMAPGSTMQVRAINAPDTIGFVTVIVRSCRKNNEFYEIGCEFEKTPPWNVLLLFG